MKKIVKITLVFILIFMVSAVSYATTIELEEETTLKENSYYKTTVTFSLKENNEDIYFLYGKLKYDDKIFEKVKGKDIKLSYGWKDIVFNENNNLFVVESDKNSNEIMKIEFKTKEKISGNTQIKLVDILSIGKQEKETKIDDASVVITYKEDKPSEDKPSEDKPSEDKPSEDKPSEDKPGEDKPSEDKPSEDKPGEDKPSEDKPSEDKPSEDKPSKEETEKEESNSKVESEKNDSLVPNFTQLPQTGSISLIIVLLLAVALIINIIIRNRKQKDK